MANDKTKKTPAAAVPETVKQFKIYLEESHLKKLKALAEKSGLKATQKAKSILVEYLNGIKD